MAVPYDDSNSDMATDYFSYPPILAHGIMMIVCWGYLLPAAALYARYYRDASNRLAVHAGSQVFSTMVVLLAGAFVLFNEVKCKRQHRFWGYTILALVILQMLGGGSHFFSLKSLSSNPKLHRLRPLVRRVHGSMGVLLMLLGFINIPQGISHVYTFSENTWHPFWLAYYVSLILWTSLFAYHQARAMQLVGGAGGAHRVGGNDEAMATFLPTASSSMTLAEKAAADAAMAAEKANLPLLTWADFDHEIVANGRQWVVGPGGVVYDVKQWITAHPGGQQVLFDAMGTSVIIDYFNVALFDQARFHAFAPAPLDVPDRDMRVNPSYMSMRSSVSTTMGPAGMARDADVEARARLTEQDWQLIVQSRRTNVHSKVAIEKLKTMAVARLDARDVSRFDKNEYRRYAMVGKDRITTPSSAVVSYKVSFCLLFPHEAYPEEPSFFLPGHVIEIRIRVPKNVMAAAKRERERTGTMGRAGDLHRDVPASGWISRYYTPLAGNMTKFNISFKVVKGGLMSTILAGLDPKDARQFQIRGPFGTPFMNPERPLPRGNGCWDTLVMLCAGSGVAPALQLLQWTHLPTYFPLVATSSFAGTSAHELTVQPRDKVLVRHALERGWVWGTNLRTHTDGYLPLRCLAPWIGQHPRMTVAVAEADVGAIMNRSTLGLVADAYPHQVRVQYRVKQMPAPGSNDVGSLNVGISQGRMTAPYVRSVLEAAGVLGPALYADDAGRGSVMVAVCGPQAFLDQCYEWLTEWLIPDEEITLLPAQSYLSLAGVHGLEQIPVRPSVGHENQRPVSGVSMQLPAATLPHKPAAQPVEEDVLYLPGLPVRSDPTSQQGEWFYLPPATMVRPSNS
ncbi:hypothetical protein GGF31_006304 [Allomyces arbusculus]|nr:hypothetical protein GGF31_006304 [Allomyces arbusculus]